MPTNFKRFSKEEMLTLYEDETQLKDLSQRAKSKFHPLSEMTYLSMGIVNFTNICIANCDYCFFYKSPRDPKGYMLSLDEVYKRIEKLVHMGCSIVGFNNGFNPKMTFELYEKLSEGFQKKFSNIVIYYLTVAEFMFLCKKTRCSYSEGAVRLKAAGCSLIGGGGAEILTERFRKQHSPGKYTVKDYFEAHRAILDASIASTATMVIGFDETLEERFEHLEQLRKFQDESIKRKNPLISFLCWTYKPGNRTEKEIHLHEYLKWLAACRIFLDNFTQIRASVLTQGEDALESCFYGANDVDLVLEDENLEKAGAYFTSKKQLEKKAEILGLSLKERAPWKNPCF